MPGGIVCSVATCKNNSKTAKTAGERLMFFNFPKDQTIEKEWILKCYRDDNWNPVHKRICSRHFKLTDYEDEMYARLLNVRPKKLKKSAIPSLFLPSTEEVKYQNTKRAKRMISKGSKVIVENLICNNFKELFISKYVEQ